MISPGARVVIGSVCEPPLALVVAPDAPPGAGQPPTVLPPALLIALPIALPLMPAAPAASPALPLLPVVPAALGAPPSALLPAPVVSPALVGSLTRPACRPSAHLVYIRTTPTSWRGGR
jgi:hypothetical protein